MLVRDPAVSGGGLFQGDFAFPRQGGGLEWGHPPTRTSTHDRAARLPRAGGPPTEGVIAMTLWKWTVSRRLVRIRRFHLRYVVREVWSLYNIPMRT
jgi:hypothetical protein